MAINGEQSNAGDAFTRGDERGFFPLDSEDRLTLRGYYEVRLMPLCYCLAVIYLVLTFLHPAFVQDPRAARFLTACASLSVLCYVVLAVGLRRAAMLQSYTFQIGLLVTNVVFLNSGIHLNLTQSAIQTTNFSLTLTALPFFTTVPWHYTVTILCGWMIWLIAGPLSYSDNWAHYFFLMLMSTAISVLIYSLNIKSLVLRSRAERQLEKAKRDAEAANEVKSQFLSRASHELKTPLSCILGFSSLLKMDALSSDQHDKVETIRTSAKHLLKLVNDLLEFSGNASSHQLVKVESIEVRSILKRVVSMVETFSKESGVLTHLVEEGSDPILVEGNTDALMQVFLNLASNGIKYNRPKGTLVIQLRRQGRERVQIDFQDTGIGISQDKMSRLYQPFDRLDVEKSTGSIRGVGLGLGVAFQMVEQMGGTMHVSSQLGKGSVFSVLLRQSELKDLHPPLDHEMVTS